MVKINLQNNSIYDKNLGNVIANSKCTCTECGICVACIIFAPAVAIALTGALLATLNDIQSPE